MKKEIPQGAIIGAIVLVVLVVIGFAWKTLSGDTPERAKSDSIVKPDAAPDGGAPSGRQAPPKRTFTMPGQ